MTEFEVATETIGNGTTVVTVRGEVDLETAPEFDRHLQAALGSGASAVIVDLSPCEFFDSSGLNVLARANHRHDGLLTLALVAPRESIPRRTIEITQFDHLFRLYAERDAAVRAAANHVNAKAEETSMAGEPAEDHDTIGGRSASDRSQSHEVLETDESGP